VVGRSKSGKTVTVQGSETCFTDDVSAFALDVVSSSASSGTALRVYSRGVAGSGAVGTWNCRDAEGRVVNDAFTWKDVCGLFGPNLKHTYAVYQHGTGSCHLASEEQKPNLAFGLDSLGFDVFTISQLIVSTDGKAKVACLGLLDKYNPVGAITSFHASHSGFSARLGCSGAQLGFYIEFAGLEKAITIRIDDIIVSSENFTVKAVNDSASDNVAGLVVIQMDACVADAPVHGGARQEDFSVDIGFMGGT